MQMATSIETDNGEMIVKRVSVPVGLEELMEGLTKEVMLKKPKDIYVFASEYFSNLLNLREKGSLKVAARRVQSITKQISADNVGKHFKPTKLIETRRQLSEQRTKKTDTTTKKSSLTAKKIVLGPKEERDGKKTERTKTLLDKHKARKNSKENLYGNKDQRKSITKPEDKEKKTPRVRDRSSSINSNEGSLKSRRSSHSSTSQDRTSSNKSSPRKLMLRKDSETSRKSLRSDLKSTGTKQISEETRKDKLENLNTSGNVNQMVQSNIEGISQDKPQITNENSESNNVCVGCTVKSDGIVDSIVSKEGNLISSTIPPDVEIINQKTEQTEEKNENISVDEVDTSESFSEGKKENKEETENEVGSTETITDHMQDISLEEKVKVADHEVSDLSKSNAADTNRITEIGGKTVGAIEEINNELKPNGSENEENEKREEGNETKSDTNIIERSTSELLNEDSKKEKCEDILKNENEKENDQMIQQDVGNRQNEMNLGITVSDEQPKSLDPTIQTSNENTNIKSTLENSDVLSDKKDKANENESSKMKDNSGSVLAEDKEENKENIENNHQSKDETSINLSEKKENNLELSSDSVKVDEDILLNNETNENNLKQNNDKKNDKNGKAPIKMKSLGNLTVNEKLDDENKNAKRVKSVDSNEKDYLSNFDVSKLHDEIMETHELSKSSNFKSSYNPYILRQEIKQASDSSKKENNKIESLASDIYAAIKIQSLWRGFLARKQTSKKLLSNKSLLSQENVSSEIKPIIKESTDNGSEIVTASEQASDSFKKENKLELLASEIHAAMKIQSLWRGFLARKQFSKKLASNKNYYNQENVVSSEIKPTSKESTDNSTEMVTVKKIANEQGSEPSKKENKLEALASDIHAAIKIQSLWRGFLTRKQFSINKISHNRQNDNSSEIVTDGKNNESNQKPYIARNKQEDEENIINGEKETNKSLKISEDQARTQTECNATADIKGSLDEELKETTTSNSPKEDVHDGKLVENATTDSNNVGHTTSKEETNINESQNKNDITKNQVDDKENVKTEDLKKMSLLLAPDNKKENQIVDKENSIDENLSPKSITQKFNEKHVENLDCSKLNEGLDVSKNNEENCISQKEEKNINTDSNEKKSESNDLNNIINRDKKQEKVPGTERDDIDLLTRNREESHESIIKASVAGTANSNDQVTSNNSDANEVLSLGKQENTNLKEEKSEGFKNNTISTEEVTTDKSEETKPESKNADDNDKSTHFEQLPLQMTAVKEDKITQKTTSNSSQENINKDELESHKTISDIKNNTISTEEVTTDKSEETKPESKNADDNNKSTHFEQLPLQMTAVKEDKITQKTTSNSSQENINKDELESHKTISDINQNKITSEVANQEKTHTEIMTRDDTINTSKEQLGSEILINTKATKQAEESKSGSDTRGDSSKLLQGTDINKNSKPISEEVQEPPFSKTLASTTFVEHSLNSDNRIKDIAKPEKDDHVIIKTEAADNKESKKSPNDIKLHIADAVLKIQAVWRGFKVRKHLEHAKLFRSTVHREIKDEEALEIAKKENKNKAILKIQAAWRGYKVRKNIKDVDSRLEDLQKPQECDEMPHQRGLTDEEIFKAATKIQAGVRGYMVRKKRNTVSKLNSITEETSSEGKLNDEFIIESLNNLQDVPDNSPEPCIETTEKKEETNVIESAPKVLFTENKSDSKMVTNTTEVQPEKINTAESNENVIHETTGNEASKNNASSDTKEDSKKAENELSVITPELNPSITNKLSTSDTGVKIDDTISNDFINKNEFDPISYKNLDESSYECAPTRPVTSSTNKEAQDDEKTSEEEFHQNNEKSPKKAMNDLKNVKSLTETVENESETSDKKITKSFSNQESVNSTDSVSTVIFNDGEKNNSTSQSSLDQGSITDPANISHNASSELKPETDPKKDNKIDDNVDFETKNELVNENEGKILEDTDKTISQTKFASPVNNDEDFTKQEIVESVGNEQIGKEMQTKESSNVSETLVNSSIQPQNNKKSQNGYPQIEEVNKNQTEEIKKAVETNVQNSITEMRSTTNETIHNKLNIPALKKEIHSSNEQLQELVKANSEDKKTVENRDINKNEISHPDKSRKTLGSDSVHNKVNMSSLESEIVSSKEQGQELESIFDKNEERNVGDATSESNGRKNSSTGDEATSVLLNNKKEEPKMDETEEDIMHGHIPLRQLSEIKEEDTCSSESLKLDTTGNLESNTQTATSKSKGSSHEEATSPRGEIKLNLQNEEATINLLHSGEFHDTITVPLPVTPPSRTSSRQTQNQTDERQASPPGLVHSGELHDNVLPLSVQLNDASPAGAEILTSPRSKSVDGNGQDRAQASNKDASTCESTQSDNRTSSEVSMETEKRNNASVPKKNMEVEAATKIQAGFRGYQVRKQLKDKIRAPGDISNQRRSARRKSSGRITDSGRIVQNKKTTSDIEEKSAVKIQAGIRGFLVRRRQKKQKQGKQ